MFTLKWVLTISSNLYPELSCCFLHGKLKQLGCYSVTQETLTSEEIRISMSSFELALNI
jgi:hypothetical protein